MNAPRWSAARYKAARTPRVAGLWETWAMLRRQERAARTFAQAQGFALRAELVRDLISEACAQAGAAPIAGGPLDTVGEAFRADEEARARRAPPPAVREGVQAVAALAIRGPECPDYKRLVDQLFVDLGAWKREREGGAP